MREIKFRAWNEDEKEMQLAFDLSQNPKYWWEDNKDYSLMQFTGLKDKNGKEIYEGDVLCLDSDSDVIRLVVWHQPIGGFGLKYEEKPERILPIIVPMTIERVLAYKLLGNKFENPELLENKNEV